MWPSESQFEFPIGNFFVKLRQCRKSDAGLGIGPIVRGVLDTPDQRSSVSRRPMSIGNRQLVNGAYWLVAGLVILFLAPAVYAEEGMAARYSDAFQGRRNAEGGSFDQEGLTAATHGKYPFGTKVKVTNLKTNKSVVVTVTDRLPARNATLIDISRRAAREIGMERAGRARVSVEVQP